MKNRNLLFWLWLCLFLLNGCAGPAAEISKSTDSNFEEASEEAWFWDDYSMNEDSTVLTMACWMATSTEVRLVSEFNRTHSDYQIQLVSYYDGNADDFEAALLRMRTKLLTGDAPDLYYLNTMDVMALEQAHMLMDLYPLMSADETFCENDYFMNIWNLFAVDGELYEFIPFFAIRGLVGPASVVQGRTGWTYDEMEMFIAEHKGVQAVEPVSLAYMIQGSGKDFMDIDAGTCNFTSGTFAQWMSLTKSFVEADDSKSGLLSPANLISGVGDYVRAKAYYQETPQYTGLPSANGDGPFAVGVETFAISSTTSYVDGCWSFLRWLLTQEVLENYPMAIGMPMRRDMVEEELSRAMLDPADEEFLLHSDEYHFIALTKEETDAFLDMLDSVTHTKLRYDGVTDLLEEEITLWLNGAQTQDATIAYLQDRVGTYLAEHK